MPVVRQVASNPVGASQQVNVQPAAFGAATAGATAGLGQSLINTTSVLDEIQNRKEGLAREADDTAYTQFLEENYNALKEADDFSEEAIGAAKTDIIAYQKKLLEGHKGGSLSRELLRSQLERRRIAAEDQLNINNLAFEDNKLKMIVDRKLNSTVKNISQDARILDGTTDIDKIIGEHIEGFKDQLQFAGLSKNRQEMYIDNAKGELARAAFVPLIASGNFDKADKLLESDKLAEYISPDERMSITERIVAGREALMNAQKAAAAASSGGNMLPGFPNYDPEYSSSDLNTFSTSYDRKSETFNTVKEAYATLMGLAASPSGMSDFGLMSAYVRMTSPGIVNDAERMAIAQSGGLGQKVQQTVNQVLKGDGLTPTQRQDLLKSAYGVLVQQRNLQLGIERQAAAAAAVRFPGMPLETIVPSYTGQTANWKAIELNSDGSMKTPIEELQFQLEQLGQWATGANLQPSPSNATPAEQPAPTPGPVNQGSTSFQNVEPGQQLPLPLTPSQQLQDTLGRATEAVGNFVDELPDIGTVATMTKQGVEELFKGMDTEEIKSELEELYVKNKELWNAIYSKLTEKEAE